MSFSLRSLVKFDNSKGSGDPPDPCSWDPAFNMKIFSLRRIRFADIQ